MTYEAMPPFAFWTRAVTPPARACGCATTSRPRSGVLQQTGRTRPARRSAHGPGRRADRLAAARLSAPGAPGLRRRRRSGGTAAWRRASRSACCLVVAISLGAVAVVTSHGRDATARCARAVRASSNRRASPSCSLLESRATAAAALTRLVTELPIFRAHLTDSRLVADEPTIREMVDELPTAARRGVLGRHQRARQVAGQRRLARTARRARSLDTGIALSRRGTPVPGRRRRFATRSTS